MTISLNFVNQTPLTLTLARGGARVATLPPLKSVAQSGNIGDTWTISDSESAISLKSFRPARETEDTCVIVANDVVSGTLGDTWSEKYANRTAYWVDLYRVVSPGTEERFATLEPGEASSHELPVGQAVVVRALATQELVAARFHGDRSATTREITDAFRAARRQQLQPKRGARRVLDNLKLVEAAKTAEPPESRLYIHKSVHKYPMEAQFNTLSDVVPKRIRISGATLIWDRRDDQYALMSLQGADRLDVKTLEMYADRVIIRTPLLFPRTDVTIYARELVFEGDGSITTSPQSFHAPAISPFKTKDGHPADESGKATYRAADGKHGEKAGDIHLFVRKIIQDRSATRFICCGSDGQKSETGGLKPYAPPDKPEYPAAADGPDLRAVTPTNINDFIKDKFLSYYSSSWRWPGEAHSPQHAAVDGDALNLGHVVNLKLISADDRAGVGVTSLLYLPSRSFEWTNFLLAGDYELDKTHDPARKRPGNGPDAYPSGQTGNGADGGTVTSHFAGAPLSGLWRAIGGVSPLSDSVEGGRAGTPQPAYWLTMKIIYNGTIKSDLNPSMKLVDVSASPGASADGRRGKYGNKAWAKATTEVGLGWMNPSRPLALKAVIACARDAFRNGHRDLARSLLEPYHAAFVQEQRAGRKLSAALTGLFAEIVAMQANMASNLDYYGHPIGWLPRLHITTSYNLWQNERQYASKLLYYAATIEEEWERLEDQQETLTETSNALRREIDVAVEDLPKAYGRLTTANDTLRAVTDAYRAKGRDIESLRQRVAGQAQQRIEEQRVFSAFCKIAGGLMESIPVGQPYVGLAGKTFGIIGDFDWNQPDPMNGVSKGLTDLGDTVSTFLSENHEMIVGNSSQRLRNQIREASNSIDTLESGVTAHQAKVDAEWEPLRAAEKSRLQQRIKDTEKLIAGLSGNDKTEAEEERLELQEELKRVAAERMSATRDRLETELTALTEADEAAERKHKRQLLAKISALEVRKGDLEGNVRTYQGDLERREDKTGKLLTSLKDVGSGLSRIGEGITILSAPYDEAEVDRMADAILQTSEFRQNYLALVRELKMVNRKKAQAASDLSAWAQLVADYTGQISKNLAELVALSDQRQAADDVLDAGVLQYLQGIQKRARERLLWYQYNFAKAFEYETLRDPGRDFLNLDNWVDRLRAAKRKLAQLKDADPVEIDEADFEAVEDMVVRDQLLELAKKLVTQRLQFKSTKSTFAPTLTAAQREALLRDGKVSFMLPDLGVGSFKDIRAKIVTLVLEDFDVEPTKKQKKEEDDSEPKKNDLILDLDIQHSGESIVRDLDDSCYYFQCARDDAPISWGFVYNGRKVGDERLIPDEEIGSETDKMLDNTDVEYREYCPSLYGEITLWINRTDHGDPAKLQALLTRIKAIKDVKLKVEVERARKPVPTKPAPVSQAPA